MQESNDNLPRPSGMQFRHVDHVPDSAGRRGPRSSECMNAVETLKASPTGAIVAKGSTPEESERFYKSMIQWRKRHREDYPTLGVKKDGDDIYLSFEQDEEPEESVPVTEDPDEPDQGTEAGIADTSPPSCTQASEVALDKAP